jgi:hypothetical protein
MKRLALLLLTCLALPVVSLAAELTPFEQVRRQNQNYPDTSRVTYLFNRCAALQLNVAALLERKGQKQGAKDYENLAQHYMVLSEVNEREIDKKFGLKSKDTVKTINRNVSHLSELYTQRMNANAAKRGEYIMGDAQLESELKECSLPEEFKKKASVN